MSLRSSSLTMVDAARPRVHPLIWDAALVVGFGMLMAGFGRIAVYLPFTPVPITGQTFGRTAHGRIAWQPARRVGHACLSGRRARGTTRVAGGASAWTPSPAAVPWIIGPSAGYLSQSYPIAAFVVGLLAEHGWDRTFRRALLAMLSGEVLIYAIGLTWLAIYVGVRRSLPLGLLPFIPGDALKVVLAAAALPSGWRFLKGKGVSAHLRGSKDERTRGQGRGGEAI